VRSRAAYEQAHIPGAIHIPLEELDERAGELDGNKKIVLYCLSPNDAMSLQGAMILYRLGFTDVSVLKDGIQRWYSDGYPIEGTLLTPTPRFVGPPWTVTPLPTSTPLSGVTEVPTAAQQTPSVTITGTVPVTATATATRGG
jgi:rhodanese-related sulfurtransferase